MLITSLKLATLDLQELLLVLSQHQYFGWTMSLQGEAGRQSYVDHFSPRIHLLSMPRSYQYRLARYTPAIDIWSICCIYAEFFTGTQLFSGKSTVHQLDLIADLLGKPLPETVAAVRNEKTRKYNDRYAEEIYCSNLSEISKCESRTAFDAEDAGL